MPFSTRIARLLLIVYCLAGAVGLYGFWVEPYRIQVSRHRVPATVKSPIRIAHVSDLHTRGFGRRERALKALLEEERPDLIVATGDHITFFSDYERVRDVFSRLKAPLGVWLVRGNWENAIPLKGGDDRAYFAEKGLRLLVNEGVAVREDLWLAGFDDALNGRPDREGALGKAPPGVYRVGIFHSPMFFPGIAGHLDLALAGHTHGGQIRAPWGTPLYTPPGSGEFVSGWYDAKNTRMYVSRGVGTTLVDFRLFCPPELPVFELIPEG